VDIRLTREAEAIISEAEQGKRADAVLKQSFKASRSLSPEDKTLVSRAVFTFYRWRGWLDAAQSIRGQLYESESYATRFARDPESFSDAELAARSVPKWTVAKVKSSPRWMRSLQSEPPIWLRCKRSSRQAVLDALGNVVCPFPKVREALLYRGEEDLFRTPAFHQGLFEIQDIASQAVGLIANPQLKETWWDACAGEGGKTLHLSDLMNNTGLIWASDLAAWRLQMLKRRCGRAGVFNYRSAPWDGSPKLPTRTKFDGVLVDAPCSGIGTWQRNPQAKWTTTETDIQELSELQARILKNAAPSVKPGGTLVYAVCTLSLAETEKVAQDFTSNQPEFEPLARKNPLFEKPNAVAQHWLLPHEINGNGMFVSLWSRRKE
jgi:16S rRNA (cytosine967-C5)-methyltransferase